MAYPASPSKGCREPRLEQLISKLPGELSEQNSRHVHTGSNHARARKCVPAKPDAITVLDLTPLVFQRLVIHVGQRERKRGSQKWPKVLLVHHSVYYHCQTTRSTGELSGLKGRRVLWWLLEMVASCAGQIYRRRCPGPQPSAWRQ
jgi:hypothetical protein